MNGPEALHVRETLSDGSKVHNVELRDADGKHVATIGCVDEQSAAALKALIREQSFIEGV